MKTTVVVLCTLGLLLAGCLTNPSDADDAPIRLDQRTYAVSDRSLATVEASYSNSSDAVVYIEKCGYRAPRYILQRQTEAGWEDASTETCIDVGIAPLEVSPGRDTNTAHAVAVNDRLIGTPLRLACIIIDTNGALLPVAERVSDPFAVVSE